MMLAVEFIVMALILMRVKSKMLIPRPKIISEIENIIESFLFASPEPLT